MLRVGGVTFCHTANYGTSLQAYALQQAIEKIEIGGEKCSYKLICLRDCKDYPERQVRHKTLIGRFYVGFNRKRFRRFEDKNIHFRMLTELKELPGLNREFDVFVCGSDVIWNPEFNEGLGAFYLDFAEKYAFSYAASFGRENISPEELDKAGTYISRLQQIGLREKSAETIVKKYTDAPVKTVVDPVVLLKAEDWNALIGEPPKKEKKEKYIFTYVTHVTGQHEQFLRALQGQTGLPVKRALWLQSFRMALKQKQLRMIGPIKWLQELRDAEYVVTNSFHATVFSVLFHKKFFTVVGGEVDKKGNVRMFDFLSNLGLSDRILNKVPEKIDLSSPDFALADESLHAQRKASVDFLEENLNNAYCRKV